MSAAIPVASGTLFSAGRGKTIASPVGGGYGVARFPTDSVGTYTLTLTHIVVGSAIQIEAFTSGEVFASLVADTTNETIPLSAYASGSPNNNLRIKVRKGEAAPYYQDYETQATAFAGSQSIFVSQIPE